MSFFYWVAWCVWLDFVSDVSDERVCETGRGLTCAVNIRIKGMQLRKDPGVNACAPKFDLEKTNFLGGSVQFPLSNPATVLVGGNLEN